MPVHWTINGISACQSALTSACSHATSCAHNSAKDPDLLRDIKATRAAWPMENLHIVVHEGSCNQQDWMCHCEDDCDCEERAALPIELDIEKDRQNRLLAEREAQHSKKVSPTQ